MSTDARNLSARLAGIHSYPADQHAPFGIDAHQCIARLLTLRAGTMFVDALIENYTWSVTGDGPRQFGHAHWQPAPSSGIDLRGRSG